VNDQSTFWFAAKPYGFGWGLPVRWQGWVVLVAYLTLLLGGVYYFKSRRDVVSLLVYVGVLTIVLVAVMAVKGERPLRWRWGK
jgi:uncharacterized membrane protein